MNAVNLLPPDLRKGSGAPARSGGAVYVVLGVLALAVLLVGVTAVLKGRVTDRESTLAQTEAEAVAAEQQAQAVAEYKQLAADTGTRVSSVRKVATERNDWAASLTQVSETVGTKISFLTLNASATPTSSSGGAASSLRSALPGPALDVSGCAESHPAVARLIARFRAMNEVKRVSLASSDRGDAATSDTGNSSEGCPSNLPARFAIVIFLEGGATAPATAAGTAAGTTDASTTTPATDAATEGN